MARMLCIEGYEGDDTCPPLIAGQVYDVDVMRMCCRAGALAHSVYWKEEVMMTCPKCSHRYFAKYDFGGMVPWKTTRFAKWDDPQISNEEVRELYSTTPVKEKA